MVKIPRSVRPLLAGAGRLAKEQGTAAYAVGGCVRDWCLGLTRTPDVDLTVEGNGTGLARALAEALAAGLVIHPAFGTSTLTMARGTVRRLDVATCRREAYARPAAYPRVERGTLQEDLFRRDFTINAMAVATAPGRIGRLIDPFGGQHDLRAGLLRVLHARSFSDDPSRILRGVRFAARLGFSWEPRTRRGLVQALREGALGWLNAGRLERELTRMAQEPDPQACLLHLAQLLSEAGSWKWR